MSNWMKNILAIIAMSVSFGGCAAFAARADPSSFYILGALPEVDLAADKTASGIKADFSVGLGPIELPAYLDRQQIVTRTSTNRLSYSENDRWAAPLAESLSRVLGQNISYLLNPAQMVQFPWQSNDAPDYQVKIEVLQFEGNSNQEAWLTARWTVLDRNKKILVSQRSQLNRRAGSQSTEDFVKALSETLGDLSREIATALRSFEEQRKP
ncbi:MAG TPA: PqiC family protein [Candidatus Binatia bacterium]|nr:PqiC family protein [Candidatus Binatia bacterium]